MNVSILIGTRNRIDPLRRCLQSVRKQSRRPHEVLVLDDASDELDVAQALEDFPEVRVIRAPRPLGVGPGRNRLFAEASGDLFVVLDDDAYFADAAALERLVVAALERPRAALFATRIIDQRGGRERVVGPFSARRRRMSPELMERPGLVSYFIGCGHAVRRTLYEETGGYDERFVWGEEELELSYRAIGAGREIYYVPDVVVVHRPLASVLPASERHRSELFYHTRNRVLIAWKYLPARYVIPYLAIWMSRSAATAIRQRQIGDFVSGVFSGLRILRDTPRVPLDGDSVTYLERNHGRLWF